MTSEPSAPDKTPPNVQAPTRAERVKKLAISVLLVSLGLHLIAGICAIFWIVSRDFTEPKAQFEVMKHVEIPPEKREHMMATEEVTSLRPKPVFDNRIQSLRPAEFALPDIPEIPLDQLVEIDTDTIVSENVVLSDSVSSRGTGSGGGGGFFGGAGKAGSGLLEGTFYDLKQNKDGRRTSMNADKCARLFHKFTANFDMNLFRNYYVLPRKLYTTQLAIPVMPATRGPTEFGAGKEVKPGLWLVRYTANVVAPDTAKYRFVGKGDDIMFVRINNQFVLDASWESQTPWSRLDRKKTYPAPPRSKWTEFYVGKTFEVEKGKTYPLEIVISEIPGGLFSQILFIEKIGATTRQHLHGGPVLPLFQMGQSPIAGKLTRLLPPTVPAIEYWKPAPKKRSFFDMP